MKTGLLLGLIAVSFSMNAFGKDPPGFTTEKQKFSYTVGFQLGQNLKRQKLDIDPKIVTQGMQSALSGTSPKLTPEEMRASIQAYQKKEQDKGKHRTVPVK